jgi:hypothetical protein
MTTPNTEATKTPTQEAHEAFLRSGRIVKDGEPHESQEDPTQRDYKALHIEAQAEVERLNAIISAGRFTPQTNHPLKDAKPSVTSARLKAMVGPVKFLQMTRSEKLVGLGLNPAEVDDEFLKRCFGRGNDGKAAQELYKSNPFRYRQLREAADILSIYAA